MSEDGNNTWECSVCTYYNSAEAFKCLMCDVRKGTSTRKPRINLEMVAKQVARQQEQIKQQAIKSVVKGGKPEGSGKVGRRSGSGLNLGEDSNSSVATDASSTSGRNSPATSEHRAQNGFACSNSDSPSTAASLSFYDKINSLSTASSSKSAASSSRSHSVTNNDAQSEDEVDENENKSSAAHSAGRNTNATSGKKARKKAPPVAAVKPRLKNVDRHNVEVKEVTVKGLTVTFTEFKVKRKLSEVSENQLATSSEPPPKKTHKTEQHQPQLQSPVSKTSSSPEKDSNNNSSGNQQQSVTPAKAAKGAAAALAEGGKKTSPNKGTKAGKEKAVATVVEETAAPKSHHSSPPKKLTAVAE